MSWSTRTIASAPFDDGAEAGAEGNARLTSAMGLILIVMLAVEGYTILDVRGMITLHIFLGVMLVGPVLLKIASTLYRFVRYYRHSPVYVRKGPPHIVLRVLGPLVIVSSLALLGTGIALLYVHSDGGLLLTLHQGSFIVWVGVMTLHVLGHLREAAVATWHEVWQSSPRRRLRLVALVLALVVGVGAASALLPSASYWINRGPGIGRHDHRH
ncbi:MAG: hypothetical protein ABI301_07215 [Jatrophihabitantaceae bacterium]